MPCCATPNNAPCTYPLPLGNGILIPPPGLTPIADQLFADVPGFKFKQPQTPYIPASKIASIENNLKFSYLSSSHTVPVKLQQVSSEGYKVLETIKDSFSTAPSYFQEFIGGQEEASQPTPSPSPTPAPYDPLTVELQQIAKIGEGYVETIKNYFSTPPSYSQGFRGRQEEAPQYVHRDQSSSWDPFKFPATAAENLLSEQEAFGIELALESPYSIMENKAFTVTTEIECNPNFNDPVFQEQITPEVADNSGGSSKSFISIPDPSENSAVIFFNGLNDALTIAPITIYLAKEFYNWIGGHSAEGLSGTIEKKKAKTEENEYTLKNIEQELSAIRALLSKDETFEKVKQAVVDDLSALFQADEKNLPRIQMMLYDRQSTQKTAKAIMNGLMDALEIHSKKLAKLIKQQEITDSSLEEIEADIAALKKEIEQPLLGQDDLSEEGEKEKPIGPNSRVSDLLSTRGFFPAPIKQCYSEQSKCPMPPSIVLANCTG